MSTDASGRIVARNFIALGSGEVAARLIAFGATVYLAHVLGASRYGVIGFATAVMLYLSRVADFGIELSGARDLAKDPRRLESLASTVLTVRLLIAGVLIIVTSAIGLFLLPQPDGKTLALYSLTLLAVGGGTRWVYLGLERTSFVALARTVGEALMAVSVLALVHGPAQVVRVPAAQVGGDLLAAVLLYVWLRRHGHRLRLRLDWAAAQPLFRRATPLMLSALLGLVVFNSDVLFLRVFRGTTTVGHYVAAYTLISFLINLGLTYRMSLLPTLSRLEEHSPARNALYHGAMAHVFAFAFPVALLVSLLAPLIMEVVFGPAYRPAIVALQILSWSVPLCLLRDVPSAVLLANGREDQFFRLTASGAVLNIALNLILIPRFGMVGAGISTLAAEGSRMVIALVYARKHGFRLHGFSLFGRVTIATATVSALLFFTRPAVLWVALPIAGLGYAAALVAVGAVRLRRGEFPALNV